MTFIQNVYRTIIYFTAYFLGGLLFFAIVPPVILPILSFFFPTIVLPIYVILACFFAFWGIAWTDGFSSDCLIKAKIKYQFSNHETLYVIHIQHIGKVIGAELLEKLKQETSPEHYYRKTTYLKKSQIYLYYNDAKKAAKAYKIIEDFKNEESKKSPLEQTKANRL